MNLAYLLTGGNLGDRVANLATAADKIGQGVGAILQRSSLYQTEAWGMAGQPDFLNQVLLVATPLGPQGLLQAVLQVENEMGRQRQEKYGPRVIDIDLLFYNQLIIDQPNLKVPHPHLHERRFTLIPLAEIAPGYRHPVLQQTIARLWAQCPDPLDVKKYSA